jgi:hypothetical protein
MKKIYRKSLKKLLPGEVLVAIGSLLLLLLTAGTALSNDISIIAKVDRTQITLDGSIELAITVSGPVRKIDDPILPDLSAFEVYSSGKSTNISILPGAISYQTEYVYLLSPFKVGKFTIQPAKIRFKGKDYSTKPITIRVTHQAQPQKNVPSKSTRQQKKNSTSEYFIEQSVDLLKPYIGQQVTMIFRFYQSRDLFEQPSLQWPDYKGFWVEDLPPKKTYHKVINGVNYKVTEIRKALFPTVTGKNVIEPSVLTIPPSSLNSIFNFDHFNSRRKQRNNRNSVLRSNSITLDVKPLPETKKPSDFTGAVGSYSWRISIDKDTVEVDQPITLKASIVGSGNIKKLPGVEIPELQNFRFYDSGSNENISSKGYKISGFKSFEWVLIPTAPGEYELPELKFSFFDPWSKKYRTQSKKPGTIYVKPSSMASLAPGDRSVNIIPSANVGFNYIVTDLSEKQAKVPLYKSKLVWLLQLLPILWFIGLASFINRRKKFEGDKAYARRKRASKAAQKALKQAHDGINNPQTFYSLVFNGIIGFISDKLNITAAGLTNSQIIQLLKETQQCDSIIDDLANFIDECDSGRFTPIKPSSKQARQIYNRAEILLSELDRSLK